MIRAVALSSPSSACPAALIASTGKTVADNSLMASQNPPVPPHALTLDALVAHLIKQETINGILFMGEGSEQTPLPRTKEAMHP